MGTTYTSTFNIKCRKEHTCVSCGTVYSYDFARKIVGRGRTAKGAQKKAQKLAESALQSQVDLHPCPACGIYQPDMIGQQRVRWHRQTFIMALLVFVLIVVLRVADVLQANVAEWLLVAAGTLAALQMVGKELKNFNANTEKNRGVAADRVAAGKLQHPSGQTAEADPQWIRIEKSLGQRSAGLILLIALLSLAAAELLRMVHGWPINAAAYPPVVGPGDTTCFYMQEQIDSVNGYWRGDPKAMLTVAGGGGAPVSADCTTNQNDWGDTISVDSDAKHNHPTPWIEMTIPNDASLAGKVIDCDISLDVQYPQLTGDSSFQTEDQTMREHQTLSLASVGAGALYTQVWWGGGIAGMVLILLAARVLTRSARHLQTRAHPTKILTLAPPPPPPPPQAAPGLPPQAPAGQ
ncbi:MAG TPA: hypothetical protein VMD30_09645 [Tepidisphaeraceae bacterium]|nr:hypothetical protein [Tepidisphaeraceae bacterium]